MINHELENPSAEDWKACYLASLWLQEQYRREAQQMTARYVALRQTLDRILRLTFV